MAKVKAQGTNVYLIDPDDGSVLVVDCITSISGITAARDQIETTCLEDNARTYEAGLATPGTASFGIQIDPTSQSHLRVHQLYAAGTKVEWAVGLGDGTAAPTVDSAGDFVLPSSRSWIAFNGYVSDFPWEIALNTVVTNTISVQVSDFPSFLPKV